MAESNNFSNEPVTAIFGWKVGRGNEEIFEHMMHDIHKVARTFPGHMGVTTLKSPTDKDIYQTVLRFDTTEHLEDWLSSSIRSEMMQPLLKYARIDATDKANGLETWFELPGQLVNPPPKWKMTVVTFIAIYPISLLYTLYLTPDITNWPAIARALVLPILAPLILTYILMPLLTQRVFRRWLYKNS